MSSFAGDPSIAVVAIGGGLAFALVTLLLVSRLLKPLGRIVEKVGYVTSGMLTFVLILVMLGAWFTDDIRIYAVFGAFVMGLAIPRGKLGKFGGCWAAARLNGEPPREAVAIGTLM